MSRERRAVNGVIPSLKNGFYATACIKTRQCFVGLFSTAQLAKEVHAVAKSIVRSKSGEISANELRRLVAEQMGFIFNEGRVIEARRKDGTTFIPVSHISDGFLTVKIDTTDEHLISRLRILKSPRELSGYRYYVSAKIQSKDRLLHRVVLDAHGFEVDHINGDGLDNRRCNLRLVTKSENQQNILGHRDSVSGHKNVYWQEKKQYWLVQACLNYKRYSGGTFKNLDDAIAAATALRIRLHTHCKENSQCL